MGNGIHPGQGKNFTIRMSHNASDLGLAHRTDLTVETLDQVEASSEKLPSPSEITNAVSPVIVTGKWREGVAGISDEATYGMGIQSEEERNEQVVSVPEGLERLLADAVVGRGVHEQHAEQHGVTSDTTWLRVVDLQGRDGSDLSLLDIEEAETTVRTFGGVTTLGESGGKG